MDKKKILKKYIFEELVKDFKIDDWDDDDSLLENRIIDSMGIVELLAFIEEKFMIKIEDEELTPENFESINTIYSLINRT